MNRLRLGVNIDHIATLRNARGGSHPDLLKAADIAMEAGADGITAHLREDRRHINDEDLYALHGLCQSRHIPLNMEMAAISEMVAIACDIKPHAVCLVPERREERTTEGGLGICQNVELIQAVVPVLAAQNIRVSLFIEAATPQIEAAAQAGAAVVEFHTGAYAEYMAARDEEQVRRVLKTLQQGASMAESLGLEVHFGHGLTYENVAPVAAITQARELNIGHFLIGEAVFTGLKDAIGQMRLIMDRARA